MKTLADLKRFLKLGSEMYMIWHMASYVMEKHGMPITPWQRRVTRVQTNGVWFKDPNNPAEKESFFEFPKANEIDFRGDKIDIYENSPEDSDRLHVMTYWIPAICNSCGSLIDPKGMCGYEGDD